MRSPINGYGEQLYLRGVVAAAADEDLRPVAPLFDGGLGRTQVRGSDIERALGVKLVILSNIHTI